MDEMKRFVGIDVAKEQLEAFIRLGGETFSVANDEVGIGEQLGQFLPADFVILEATGGLEMPVCSALAAVGLAVAIVNPRQGRAFDRATGRLAKTDRLDVEVLAGFGDAARPEARPFADEQAQALEGLVTRQHQLVEMLTAKKNTPAHAPSFCTVASMSRSVGLSALDTKLAELICDTPLWRKRDELLRSLCPQSTGCSRVFCPRSCPNWECSIANRSPH